MPKPNMFCGQPIAHQRFLKRKFRVTVEKLLRVSGIIEVAAKDADGTIPNTWTIASRLLAMLRKTRRSSRNADDSPVAFPDALRARPGRPGWSSLPQGHRKPGFGVAFRWHPWERDCKSCINSFWQDFQNRRQEDGRQLPPAKAGACHWVLANPRRWAD